LLQRDILEMCTVAYDLGCVLETINAMLPPIAADRSLSWMYPEILLYETKANIWLRNDDYVQQTLRRGGASSVANIVSNPSTHAELQIALHAYFTRRNDLVAAEESISGAVLGLLLSDPVASYTVSKILIGLIGSLINAQDAIGAFKLFKETEQFVSSSVGRESPLYAEYLGHASRLYSFSDQNNLTATLLSQSADLFEALQMDEEVKAYQMGAANSLASATLVLDGKLELAKQLHAKHPMQKRRDAILQRGHFATLTEFYFAVSDIFLASINGKPDQKWQALLAKKLDWSLDSLLLASINSYRNFSLGLLSLGRSDREAGERLLVTAAKQRVDSFEEVIRANFEGFLLASAVDRILVTIGLTAAARAGGSENISLILRGGEFLGRTLRDALGDVAVLLGSQADYQSRRDAHSYIHLLRQKREWEIDHIKKFISKDADFLKHRGTLTRQYAEAVSKLTALKGRLRQGGKLDQTKGLPSLDALQQSLSDREAFVTYFPKVDGMGKLCVRRNSAILATSPYEPATISSHVRLLQFSTAADHTANAELDKQFPVSSALYLRDYLFGGLEACAAPGVHVIVSLPNDFAGVPLGALLTEVPPREGDGFDLAKAPWLIKQMSFSVVGSARQYLATLPLDQRSVATRPFLGIGDPSLDPKQGASSAAAAVYRGSLRTPNGASDFVELPDTAVELMAVAKTFSATKHDVLLKRSATEEALRLKPLAEYDVIHFATHGLIREDLPGLTEAALLLTPGISSDPFDDGLLSVSELSRLTLGARLIVLSACNTAKYDLKQAGIGILDFQTAFTIAGAPTLLAALWSIDSGTARDIVIEFFREWRSTASPFAADALAAATRTYLAAADAPHQHPRFWAAFQIAGYGRVHGAPGGPDRTATGQLVPVLDDLSPGEVLAAGRMEDDLVISMMGDWNGRKMASIIRRLRVDGTESWAVKSHDIGAGSLIVAGGAAYVLGYTTEQPSVPVVRSFDQSGRWRWTTRFDDLEGYVFADIAEARGDLFVVAFPQLKADDSHNAWLLQLDNKGAEKRRVPIALGARAFSIGIQGLVKVWNGRLALALNFGSTLRMNYQRRDVFGLPSVCFANSSTRVYEIDLQDLRQLRSRSIARFKVDSIAVANGLLYLGGEVTDDCAMRGQAAIYSLDAADGEPRPFWSEDTLFISNISGLNVLDDQLLATLRSERTLGIETRTSSSDAGNKRWGDEDSALRESSLLYIDRAGRIAQRRNLSAGLAIFVRGVEVISRRPVLYGSIGGIPAVTGQ
jgi:hypothetical protein